MEDAAKLRRGLGALTPDSVARRLFEWRAIARASFPDARWPQDLPRGAAAVARHERLRGAHRTALTLGRAPLAALRSDTSEGSAVLATGRLGWSLGNDPARDPMSLRMAPGSTAAYGLALEAGTRFESGLEAEGSPTDGPGGLLFSVVLRTPDGDRLASWSSSLGALDEASIRTISIPLPALNGGRVSLELGVVGADASAGPQTGLWVGPTLVAPGPRRLGARGRFPGSSPARARSRVGRKTKRSAGDEPRFSILTPVSNPDLLFLDRAIASVLRQTSDDWELCVYDDGSIDPEVRSLLAAHAESDPRVRISQGEQALGISGATNGALAMARGDFVLLLDHDDELEREALARVAAALDDHPGTDIVYTDEAMIGHDNRPVGKYLKPAWSPEHFEANMYTGHLAAYRRRLVDAAGGFRSERDGSQDYDLMLRLSERTDRIVHAPGVSYYWRYHPRSAPAGGKPYAYEAGAQAISDHLERVGRPGLVELMRLPGCYRVDPSARSEPVAVALAVPRDQDLGAIATSLNALVAADPGVRLELICAAAGEHAAARCRQTGADLDLEIAVVDGRADATRAELLDLAIESSAAELIALITEPVQPISSEWLGHLATTASIPGVAVAGALTVSDRDRIERGGVVISRGLPLVADLDQPLAFDCPESGSATQTCVRNYSGADGALVVSRSVVECLGGLAAQGFDQLAEVDLCLRAREAGMRIAVNPMARVARVGARSAVEETALEELFRFQRRWWSRDTDPYYHPELSPERAMFEHLAQPVPAPAWRPAAVGDAAPASEGTPAGPREELATQFLRGEGLEIGALHSPLRVPAGTRVRYVDRLPVTLLRRHYPELDELPLVEVDILDDGERLESIPTQSQDFVIANHLLEHTGDPIGTIGNWLRVLRPGGAIFLAVPDKRYTFDFEREVTSLEHMIRDHEEGPEVSRRDHFEEWARQVEGTADGEIADRADALEASDYSVHTHVFTARELLQLLLYCDERVGPLEISALRRNGLETLVVLSKPDPARRPARPDRALAALPAAT